MSDLENLAKEAEEASNAASTLEGLAQVQAQFLGKKSKLVKYQPSSLKRRSASAADPEQKS